MIKYWNILYFCFVFTTSTMISPPPPSTHPYLRHRPEIMDRTFGEVTCSCFCDVFCRYKQRCCSRLLRCRADSQLSCENDGQHEDDQFDNTDCQKNKMHKYTQINYKFATLFIHYYILMSDMESFSEVWIGKAAEAYQNQLNFHAFKIFFLSVKVLSTNLYIM